MTELEVMMHAKEYVDMMANGVDPISGEAVEDNNFINNVRVSRCLFYVSDVLKKVIDNGGEVVRKTCEFLPFAITDEQIAKIEITAEPVGIADFTRRMGEVLDEGVKMLAATQITAWLLANGYLAENIYNGKKKKISTAKGTALGIITVDGVSKTGIAYQKNVYNEDAQRFIAENLNKISSDINSQKAGEI